MTAASLRPLYRRAQALGFFEHGFLILGATTFLNIANVVFHAAVSRNIGVAAYGTLYSVFSVIAIAAIPAGVCTTAVAKIGAEVLAGEDTAQCRALYSGVLRLFAGIAVLYALVAWLLSSALGHYLHVPSWSVIVAGVTAGCIIYLFAVRALAQGNQYFGVLALSLVIEGVVKSSLGAVLTAFKLSVAGGLAAYFLGTVASATYVAWRLWRTFAGVARAVLGIDWRRAFLTTLGAAALTASTTILSYGDVIVVKHSFSAQAAGVYAATSLAGKMLWFLVYFAPLVLVPKAVERHARGASAVPVLAAATLMVAVLSGGGLTTYVFFGPLVLHILVGSAFMAAAPLLPWYGASMALLGLTNTLASYSIAIHRFGFAVPLLVVALGTIVSIGYVHATLLSVVLVLAAGNAVGLLVVSGALAIPGRRRADRVK